jgi:putative glutamine amidotransferase
MSRPLIAVSAPLEDLPTAFGNQDCTKLTAAYTHAVYAAGGQPVIMPVVIDPPADLLERFDGLILTGGGDLDPTLYGEEPDPTIYGVRPDRDAFEIALYEEAIARDLPVLAICRGMQLVNVLRGGSLIQEIEADIDHWQAAPSFEASHKIDLLAEARLADIFSRSTVAVNSYHHQGLKVIGEGLRVTATCGAIVEAVEADDARLVAVQWHPEQMAATDDQQAVLFQAFVAEASASTTRTDEESN